MKNTHDIMFKSDMMPRSIVEISHDDLSHLLRSSRIHLDVTANGVRAVRFNSLKRRFWAIEHKKSAQIFSATGFLPMLDDLALRDRQLAALRTAIATHHATRTKGFHGYNYDRVFACHAPGVRDPKKTPANDTTLPDRAA